MTLSARQTEAADSAPPTMDEIRRLTDRNREARDESLERQLVQMRHEAFAGLERRPGLDSWPPAAPVTHLQPGELLTVDAEDLDAEALRAGIVGHGCLSVKGLFSGERVQWFVDAIDRTFEACADTPGKDAPPWYVPFKYDGERKLGGPRRWVQGGGGIWAADSPPSLYELIETMQGVGIVRTISEYMGERPSLSLDKCTLRRVPLTSGTEWHQDGAFLGPGIRTVNVWVTLSDCGIDAPGLDIVPKRLDRVLDTGTDGALFDWAVGSGAVERASADAPVMRPAFEAGDALLFDDMFLHRTAIDESMTKVRYAIETWFFAPSTYPPRQVPIALC